MAETPACPTSDHVQEEVSPPREKAQTSILPYDLAQIPRAFLLRLGRVFREGEISYGPGNWQRGMGDKAYQLERANHALAHLLAYIECLSTRDYAWQAEDNLAKVAWFCATQIELERLESQ